MLVSPRSVCVSILSLVFTVCAEYKFSPEDYAGCSSCSSPFTVFHRCCNDLEASKAEFIFAGL